MKFNEIKEQVQSGVNVSDLIIKFEYVTLASQKSMVDSIKGICIKQEYGFSKIDYAIKNLFELLHVISNFTDIELENLYNDNDNIDSTIAIDIYDFCKKHKVYDFILKNINSNDFFTLLNNEIEQEIEISNSVASVLNQTINGITAKIPSAEGIGEIMKEMPNIFASLNKPKVTTPRKKKA